MSDERRELTPEPWYRLLVTDVTGATLLIWLTLAMHVAVFVITGMAVREGVLSETEMIALRAVGAALAWAAFGNLIYKVVREYA